MIWLRQLLSYGVTLGVILALLVYAPRWQRQRLAPGFNDIDRFDPEAGFFSDSGRPFAALTAGDAILFRSADRSGPQPSVGWVAAIAGDEIAIMGHRVVVGGKPFACGPVERPDTAGVVVPRGRIFVVSDHHQTDSVATGFIPAAAYLGSLGSLPVIPPRILAYALMAVGILGIVMTGVTVWGGIARWFAVDNLRAAYVDAIAGESEAARAAGRKAYAWLPNSPATLLAAADPAAPGTPEQLLAAARGQRPADRAALAAGLGAILGHPPEGLDPDPSDLPFLVAIAAKAPGPVAGEPGQAPHAAVLAAWGASRLTAAWIAHRRSDVYAAASTLLILAPQHPQAAELTLITLALGPNPSTKAELTTSAGRIADVSRLHWLGGMLLALAPERTELRQLIGEADTVSSGDAQLAALVATAKAAPQGIEDGVIIACLQAGRQDLADELIALAPAARTARLSQTQGLLLGAFAADDPAQVSPLVATSDQLAFHLSNRAGALPSGTLVVVIGEAEVPADQVSRQGTLITVPLTVRGHQDIRITYAGTVVFAANIAL